MNRHANPKPDKAGLQHLRDVTRKAFPNLTVRFYSYGDLGGLRAPREHTFAFELVD